MKRAGVWAVVAGLILVLFYGVTALYRLRIARGDVFPEYSSLRADPLGIRALHDGIGLLPGREGVRWLRPLDRLDAGEGDVVLIAGMNPRSQRALDQDDWEALDRAAVAGARVVVAWRADAAQPGDWKAAREMRADPWSNPEAEPEEATPGSGADVETTEDEEFAESENNGTQPSSENEPPPRYATGYERRWGFRLGRRELVTQAEDPDALRGEHAPAAWPAALSRWRSDLFFLPREGDGWKVLYRRGTEAVMIERERGAGSVMLFADSFVLSNEAVQRERATPVLAALMGDARRVVFVETHLGVEIESGVAVLARRYGLGGAVLTALILAGLWIWRCATPLAPILPENEEVRLLVTPTAGLEALLRRAVPPAKLFSACIEAWRAQASESDRHRVTAAPASGAESDPVAAYNAATRTLSHKRLT